MLNSNYYLLFASCHPFAAKVKQLAFTLKSMNRRKVLLKSINKKGVGGADSARNASAGGSISAGGYSVYEGSIPHLKYAFKRQPRIYSYIRTTYTSTQH